MDTPEGRGTVTEVDLLRQRVKVRMEDSPEIISIFSNSDIAILRSGKARKNDPPIPADLAPISGSGKRVRREEEEEEPVRLDPIKFRYSTEKVVDEEPEAEISGEDAAKKQRRRTRKPRPEGQKAEAPKQEPAKKEPEQPQETGSEDSAKKQHSRRNNHRRYRKPKSEGGGND